MTTPRGGALRYRLHRGLRRPEALGASTSPGFTLIEMMMVMGISITLLAITTSTVRHVVTTARGDGAVYGVMAGLRQARDMAVARRRSVQVDFIGSNGIRLTRLELPNGSTLLSEFYLEGNVQFHRFEGVPDTPDGFGAAEVVDFGGKTPIFIADGMVVDTTGAPLSGTVFLGIPGQPLSARAVTVFGGTGHVRGYTWDGTAWMDQ